MENPIELFEQWFQLAKENEDSFPDAMSIATVDKNNRPHTRIVLMKEFNPKYMIFYTNYLSDKGKDIEKNPNVEVLFHWKSLTRQVRFSGTAKKTSRDKSLEYFYTRPRESQIAAYLSKQSDELVDFDALVKDYEDKVANLEGEVPCPEHWGGYEIHFDEIEFWDAHPYRLHERLVYTRDQQDENKWAVRRIYP